MKVVQWDFASQFIWALAAGGLSISWFYNDNGQYGMWFYLGLVPFGFCQWIISEWVGKEASWGIGRSLVFDTRLQKWPRLRNFLQSRLYTGARYGHLRQTTAEDEAPNAPHQNRNRP